MGVKIRDFFTEVANSFVGRDKEVNIIKYALLTGEHALLSGPRGTAKSAIARRILSNIHVGGKEDLFKLQLNSQTGFEHLFGGIDTKALKDPGKVMYHLKDSLADKTFAFLDEAMDAQDMILRGMLGVLNEREVLLPHQKVEAPLQTAVLTTNFNRHNEALDAFLDRIFFKIEVKNLGQKKDLVNLMSVEDDPKMPQLDFNRIIRFREEASKIKFPHANIMHYASIVLEWNKRSHPMHKVSDRRFRALKKLFQVEALINGHKQVELEDFKVLNYAFPVVGDLASEAAFGEVMELIVGSIKERGDLDKGLDKIDVHLDKIAEKVEKYIEAGEEKKLWSIVQKIKGAQDSLETIVSKGTKFSETTQRAENLRDRAKKLSNLAVSSADFDE